MMLLRSVFAAFSDFFVLLRSSFAPAVSPLYDLGAMRFVAGLMKLLGWLIIFVGVLVVVFSFNAGHNIPASPYVSPGSVLLVGIAVASSIIVVGIFAVAAGEMISAVADIAVNSAVTADNSANTLALFQTCAERQHSRELDSLPL
jgi:hypothetical protein